MRSKTKSKQIRPQSAKLDMVLAKRMHTMKITQKLQQSPLRPCSQDYHTSLNHNLLHKNYVMIRNNLSSDKKNRRAKASYKANSNDFGQNNIQTQEQFSSKQKPKHRQAKSRKQTIHKKQPNTQKQKQQKQTLQVRTSNKQKSKKDKQQIKTKFPSFKAFIGSKLRRKLQSYLLFVNMINYSIRMRYKTQEVRKYTVYVGKGNNSKLVRKLFGNRFWWNVVNKAENNNKDVNLVWSQWSKPHVFGAIPKANKIEKPRMGNEQELVMHKAKSMKSKQAFAKKLTPQILNELQHVYDLFQSTDRKNLFKKASKKQFKHQNLKELITSKQTTRTFKRMNVHLTHNHIQNHQQFTNKKNLFLNLKEFYKNQIFDIVPLTYHVTNLENQENSKNQNSLQKILEAISAYMGRLEDKKDKTAMWIVKPGQNSNRGCGIQVFKKLEHIKSHILKEKLKHPERTFIVQKYLNPFLYHRRKFDIRCYLLVTATPQIRAYYYPTGYIRTSSCQFSTKNCSNRFIHLTNDAIQKKQQQYGKYEKGNKVTYQQFQSYLDMFEAKKQLSFWKQILPKMQEIMLKTVKVMGSKTRDGVRILNPQNRQHSFELYGYDFMIDENFVPWLIEINTNPCIETGCQILQEIIPSLLENVIKICVDTVFPPPRFEDWPLNEILACPQTIFDHNKFQLIYSQGEE